MNDCGWCLNHGLSPYCSRCGKERAVWTVNGCNVIRNGVYVASVRLDEAQELEAIFAGSQSAQFSESEKSQ